MKKKPVVAVDVFCGVGGLSYGLRKAGIDVVAGIDVDPACKFPFEANNKAKFVQADIRDVTGEQLLKLYPANCIRLLAGCAPCQPFSTHRHKLKKKHEDWQLLKEFSRLVEEALPELVTMENVTPLTLRPVFKTFLKKLKACGYQIDYRRVQCPKVGIPQRRSRLVLVASLIGEVSVPVDTVNLSEAATVREAIAKLPALRAGEKDPKDPLHVARGLTATNLKRLQASRPGGTWKDWPLELRTPCHRKRKGATFRAVYGRMSWDAPSPTITTLSYNFGTGRFGHPEQDRAITPREAAILQTFPRHYRFLEPKTKFSMKTIGRLIGNAVPPRLGTLIGRQLVKTAIASQV